MSTGVRGAIIEDSMLEASDICDDISDESIGTEDDAIELSVGPEDDVIDESAALEDDMSIDDEDDWANALDASTTAIAVPVMSRRIINSLHFWSPACGFEATTSRA